MSMNLNTFKFPLDLVIPATTLYVFKVCFCKCEEAKAQKEFLPGWGWGKDPQLSWKLTPENALDFITKWMPEETTRILGSLLSTEQPACLK